MKTKIKQTSNFVNKLDLLANKYQTLLDDVWDLGFVIRENPRGTGNGFKVISKKGGDITIEANLLCRSTKDNLHVVYIYKEGSDLVEFIDIR